MNKALWLARKNYLCSLIKQVSDGHGGDDVEELRKHCKEVLNNYPYEKIEEPIFCYEEMVKKLKYYSERMRK